MAKSQDIRITVYPDAFSDTPEQRKARLVARINKALGRSHDERDCIAEPTQAQQFDDAWQDEKTEERRVQETAEQLCARLSEKMTTALGTPWRVMVERSASARCHVVNAQCVSCRLVDRSWIDDMVIELHGPESFDKRIDKVIQHMQGKPCGCVDGLTPDLCLSVFVARQTCADRDPSVRDAWIARFGALTPRQLDAARTAWSAELKRRQAEAREKERVAVVVDDDRWEP